MSWEPISFKDLVEDIYSSEERMTPENRLLWELIKKPPEKWKAQKYRGKEEEFWVIAVYKKYIIYYNDIEEGYNISKYRRYGKISEIWADQDELEIAIGKFQRIVKYADARINLWEFLLSFLRK